MATSTETRDPANAMYLEHLRAGDYGFVDAGCGSGGSLAYCQKRFNRGRGIGIERLVHRVQEARDGGLAVIRGNLVDIELPEHCVSFASMMDFLEHLPSETAAEDVLLKLARTARDFLFVRHPSFEDTEYLAARGLTFDWATWPHHTNPMRLDAFRRICRKNGWDAPVVIERLPVTDSSDKTVIPLPNSGKNPQNVTRFDRVLYKQYDLFIQLNPKLSKDEWRQIIRATRDKR